MVTMMPIRRFATAKTDNCKKMTTELAIMMMVMSIIVTHKSTGQKKH